MAFQKNEKLWHSNLVKQSPLICTIDKVKSGKTKDGNPYTLAEITINRIKHDFFLPDSVDPDQFFNNQGNTVVLKASGSDRAGNARVSIEESDAQPSRPAEPAARQQSGPAPRSMSLLEAKTHLAKTANLMRCCVKKASDIATEFALLDAQMQAIASSLFISAERQGFVTAMPLEPFTPQDLGANAVQARQHVEHKQEPEESETDIPF